MFRKIKQNTLRRNLKINSNRRDLSHRNRKITTLAILVDNPYFDDLEFLQTLAIELGVAQNKLHLAVFTKNKTSDEAPVLSASTTTTSSEVAVSYINDKDFSWLGTLKNSDVATFLDTPFDALIAFHRAGDIYLKNLIARSNAHFKIGFHPSDQSLFDLIIHLDPSEKTEKHLLKPELSKYLLALGKLGDL